MNFPAFLPLHARVLVGHPVLLCTVQDYNPISCLRFDRKRRFLVTLRAILQAS